MEESFTISSLIEEELGKTEENAEGESRQAEESPPSYHIPWGSVVLLVSEETAQKSGLFSLASRLVVNVDMSVSEKHYNAIQDKLLTFTVEHPGMVMDEKKDYMEYDEEVVETVQLVQTVVTVLLVAFMLYAIFIVLYSSFSQYRQTFGILQAVGYSRRALFGTILLEFSLYWRSFASSVMEPSLDRIHLFSPVCL